MWFTLIGYKISLGTKSWLPSGYPEVHYSCTAIAFYSRAKLIICYVLLFDCERQEAVQLLKDGIDLIPDSDNALSNMLSYPLHDTLKR